MGKAQGSICESRSVLWPWSNRGTSQQVRNWCPVLCSVLLCLPTSLSYVPCLPTEKAQRRVRTMKPMPRSWSVAIHPLSASKPSHTHYTRSHLLSLSQTKDMLFLICTSSTPRQVRVRDFCHRLYPFPSICCFLSLSSISSISTTVVPPDFPDLRHLPPWPILVLSFSMKSQRSRPPNASLEINRSLPTLCSTRSACVS